MITLSRIRNMLSFQIPNTQKVRQNEGLHFPLPGQHLRLLSFVSVIRHVQNHRPVSPVREKVKVAVFHRFFSFFSSDFRNLQKRLKSPFLDQLAVPRPVVGILGTEPWKNMVASKVVRGLAPFVHQTLSYPLGMQEQAVVIIHREVMVWCSQRQPGHVREGRIVWLG